VRCAAPAPQPLQRVQDEAEPHLELGRGVVVRGDELGNRLVEAGEAVGRDLGEEDLLGDVGGLPPVSKGRVATCSANPPT
jgi:hypothetical protein